MRKKYHLDILSLKKRRNVIHLYKGSCRCIRIENEEGVFL